MPDHNLINANIDEKEGIAWLTLSRPEKKNALSIALLAELSSSSMLSSEFVPFSCISTM
jgi:enoyl-CoA hydratase/carnithine racemase